MLLTITPVLRSKLAPALEKIASLLPPYPNIYTVLGMVLAVIAGFEAYHGMFLEALIALITSGIMDAIDGCVARIHGRVTRFGALLDSVCDRVSDAAIVYGMASLMPSTHLLVVAIVATLIYSYVRARAEALVGSKLEGVGFFERSERTVYIILVYLLAVLDRSIASILSIAYVVLITCAVLHRVLKVWRILSSVATLT